jgi:hypothetical protein
MIYFRCPRFLLAFCSFCFCCVLLSVNLSQDSGWSLSFSFVDLEMSQHKRNIINICLLSNGTPGTSRGALSTFTMPNLAQVANEHFPENRGTCMVCDLDDAVEVVWDQQRYKRTIELDPSSNIAVILRYIHFGSAEFLTRTRIQPYAL